MVNIVHLILLKDREAEQLDGEAINYGKKKETGKRQGSGTAD